MNFNQNINTNLYICHSQLDWESIDIFLLPTWDSRQKNTGMTTKLEDK